MVPENFTVENLLEIIKPFIDHDLPAEIRAAPDAYKILKDNIEHRDSSYPPSLGSLPLIIDSGVKSGHAEIWYRSQVEERKTYNLTAQEYRYIQWNLEEK